MSLRGSVVSIVAATLVVGGAVGVGPARAAKGEITPTPDRSGESRRAALRMAQAIAVEPRLVRSASFSALPPFSNPAAVSTERLGGFPRAGRSFGILSSGSATRADDRNASDSLSTTLAGPSIRGARDVTIMRIVVRVPSTARCLSVRFRFLSEEFPEFIGDIYNDSFIAELDISNWDASSKQDPTISAPHNFAQDADGRPIRINSVGATSMTAYRARGTTYDGATRVLRASTPVSPGRHVVYLSIFDQGDRQYDSAVFLDRMTIDRRSPCRSGAVVDD